MRRTGGARIVGYAAIGITTVIVAGMGAGAAPGQTVSTMSIVDIGRGAPGDVFVGQVSLADGAVLGANGSSQVGTWRATCRYLGGGGRGRHNSHFCTFVHTFPNAGSITASGKVGYDSMTTRWLEITKATGFYKGTSGTVRLTNFAQCSTPFTFYLHR